MYNVLNLAPSVGSMQAFSTERTAKIARIFTPNKRAHGRTSPSKSYNY